jgi:glutamate racemase
MTPTTPRSALRDAPIGVFDSGVGGLSVLKEIRAALPHEHLVYVADSGHAPYGDKSSDFIAARAHAVVTFLASQGVKAVVVACNTVTGLVIQQLREQFPMLPIVAIEPAVKPAAAATRTGVVGVLATRLTVQSPGLARLIEQHGQGVRVITQACPGWVELVESAQLESPATREQVAQYIRPLLNQNVDTLVLGCTHYPFLAPVIANLAGPQVRLIDPAAAVARELQRRLQAADLIAPAIDAPGPTDFWTSGSPAQATQVISALWNHPVVVRPLPQR